MDGSRLVFPPAFAFVVASFVRSRIPQLPSAAFYASSPGSLSPGGQASNQLHKSFDVDDLTKCGHLPGDCTVLGRDSAAEDT